MSITNDTSDTIRYQGTYGNIFIGKKDSLLSLYQQESIDAKKIFVNKELVEYHILLQELYIQNLIDIITKNKLSSVESGLISSITKDLETIAYIGERQELFNASYQHVLKKMEDIQSLLSEKKYSQLADQLSILDTSFEEELVRESSGLVKADGIFQKNLLSTPAFVYLIDKIHTDQRKLYSNHLKTMKQIL